MVAPIAKHAVALQLLLLSCSAPTMSAQTQQQTRTPPKVLSNFDVIEHFSENYDVEGLHLVLSSFFLQTERNTDTTQVKSRVSEEIKRKGAGLHYTTRYKLQHDVEQAQYLAHHLRNATLANYFEHTVLPIYQQILNHHLPPEEKLDQGMYVFKQNDYQAGIAEVYNKALHLTDFTAHDMTIARDGPPQQEHVGLLNSNLDKKQIKRQWLGIEKDSTAGVVVVDDLLSPETLKRVRQIMLESTVWYETKSSKEGGYVGAYIDDGMYDRLLMAVAFDLHKAFPRIFRQHAMRYMWAYKYDARFGGIRVHADDAAVNVNLWLTPDEANSDPESGGLVVFTVKPPASWDFERYNNAKSEIEKLLRATDYANITIPHKQNRAVIFDSALFHQTDNFRFKEGYENRRINLTILYGKMRRGGVGEPGKDQKDEL